ncbi:MAG: hypothetical protein NZM35_00190 [Chitinophagales bacterium]|nr:hypothetical protein [Chitinophagales bacterium]MDW8417864.1 hypothetical protein [Chitinophagales bacterium]
MQRGLVRAQIKGALPDTTYTGEYSSNYGPCLAMHLSNTSSGRIAINLKHGYVLVPDDTNVQNMMVTKDITFTLEANQYKRFRIFAMCVEASNAAPQEKSLFKLGKRAEGNLLAIAEYINRKNYQNRAAQQAVWCITDSKPLSAISCSDTAVMNDLRRYVASLLKIPVEQAMNPFSHHSSAQLHFRQVIFTGSIGYSLPSPKKVMIALFDEQNRMKVVYVNEMQRPGEYTYQYKINSSDLSGKKHYLRAYHDGVPVREITLNDTVRNSSQ